MPIKMKNENNFGTPSTFVFLNFLQFTLDKIINDQDLILKSLLLQQDGTTVPLYRGLYMNWP